MTTDHVSIDRLSATFSALADPTRRAILARLLSGERSVTELDEPFDMSMPAISKHLRVLERAGHAANSDSFTVTTPSDQEIRMTRLFNAPRHLVFEAMTQPEHVREWWGRLGDGYSVPVCEIDLREATCKRAALRRQPANDPGMTD
jgi:DNA-binding HxlR family transcriptional regulator